jgi:hypothetical protein
VFKEIFDEKKVLEIPFEKKIMNSPSVKREKEVEIKKKKEEVELLDPSDLFIYLFLFVNFFFCCILQRFV